ncbi:hypothetical protein Leryth_022609 [Lithospermum erythrorhizon]|nr:hypothetical protein Leryth_022609 [Lithospermum erythrorhizon]
MHDPDIQFIHQIDIRPTIVSPSWDKKERTERELQEDGNLNMPKQSCYFCCLMNYMMMISASC